LVLRATADRLPLQGWRITGEVTVSLVLGFAFYSRMHALSGARLEESSRGVSAADESLAHYKIALWRSWDLRHAPE